MVCEDIQHGMLNCLKDEMEECEITEEKCATITFKINNHYSGLIKGCRPEELCYQKHNCKIMENLPSGFYETVSDCSLTCCEGDGCNDTGKTSITPCTD